MEGGGCRILNVNIVYVGYVRRHISTHRYIIPRIISEMYLDINNSVGVLSLDAELALPYTQRPGSISETGKYNLRR